MPKRLKAAPAAMALQALQLLTRNLRRFIFPIVSSPAFFCLLDHLILSAAKGQVECVLCFLCTCIGSHIRNCRNNGTSCGRGHLAVEEVIAYEVHHTAGCASKIGIGGEVDRHIASAKPIGEVANQDRIDVIDTLHSTC